MMFEHPNPVRVGDYPICAVCKKPVDELFVTEEPGSIFGGRDFTVRCHGQVESVHVTHQDMMAMLAAGQRRFYLTEAFVPNTPQQLEGERRDREDGERIDDFVDSMAVRLLERNPGFPMIDLTADCIEWDMSRDRDGYGTVTVRGKTHRIHRLSWAEVHGEIPAKMCVLHKCDNPCCFNADHLFLGTRKDNALDRDQKNRGDQRGLVRSRDCRGEKNGRARLSVEDVLQLRARLRQGESVASLSLVFGTTPNYIRAVGRGKRWKHLR